MNMIKNSVGAEKYEFRGTFRNEFIRAVECRNPNLQKWESAKNWTNVDLDFGMFGFQKLGPLEQQISPKTFTNLVKKRP